MTGAPTKHSNARKDFMRPKLEHLEGGSSVDDHAACFALDTLVGRLRVWLWAISFESDNVQTAIETQKLESLQKDPVEACHLHLFSINFNRCFVICLCHFVSHVMVV